MQYQVLSVKWVSQERHLNRSFGNHLQQRNRDGFMFKALMTMRPRELKALSIGQCLLKYTSFKTRILWEISKVHLQNCGNIQIFLLQIFTILILLAFKLE